MATMSDTDVQQIRNTIKQLQEQIAVHTKEKGELKQQVSDLDKDLKAAQTTIKRLESQAERLKAEAGASKELEVAEQHLKEAEKKITDLEKQHGTATLRIQQLEQDLNEAKAVAEKVGELEKQLSEAHQRVHQLEQELNAAKAVKPVGMVVGADTWVRKFGGQPLNRRDAPGLKSVVHDSYPIGTKVTLLEGPIPADGFHWWRVRADDGREGWVAGEELVTQPE